MNAWQSYVKQHFRSVMREYPSKKPSEVMKVLGQRWRAHKSVPKGFKVYNNPLYDS
jgi:hypothetical protein